MLERISARVPVKGSGAVHNSQPVTPFLGVFGWMSEADDYRGSIEGSLSRKSFQQQNDHRQNGSQDSDDSKSPVHNLTAQT
jgi:hypothetical protein